MKQLGEYVISRPSYGPISVSVWVYSLLFYVIIYIISILWNGGRSGNKLLDN